MNLIKLEFKNDHFLFLFLILIPISTIFSRFFLNSLIIIPFFFILYYSIKKKSWTYFNSKISKYIFIFFFYILLTNIFFQNINLSALFKIFWILAIIFIIFFFSKEIVILKETFINKLVFILFLLILFVQLDSLFQFLNPTFEDIFGYKAQAIRNYIIFGNQISLPLRLTGPFGDEQVVGFFLSSYGLLSIYLLKRIFKISNRLFFVLLIFNFFIIIISGERSSIIIYLITILISEILKPKKIYKKIIIILPFLAFFLVILFNLPTTKERFNDINVWLNLDQTNQKLKDKSILNNIINSPWGGLWYSSYEIWKEKPIIGIGLRNYSKQCKIIKDKIEIKTRYEFCSTHPHNYFIEILLETGLIGLLIFFCIIYKIYYIFLTNFRNNIDMIMLISFITALLFPLKPSGAIFSSWYGSFFWFSLGIFLIIENLNNKKLK